MKRRRPRQRRRGRIEIIPMIDVMFFLLATFMLASLTMENLHSLPVDLTRGEATPLQAAHPVTLTVTPEGGLLVNQTAVSLETLADTIRPLLDTPDTTLIVAADSAAPNGVVLAAMIRARQAGARHFLFAVKPG
jgi:biopolymer transport protein ExbD